MKRLLQFLILIFVASTLSAQDTVPVHLLKRLAYSKHDSARVKILIELSITENDSTLKFFYADSALVLSKQLNALKYRALAEKNMANTFQLYNKNAKALANYKSAGVLFKKLDNRAEQAAISYEIGRVYYMLDDFQESINFHQKSLGIRYELNDTVGIIQSEYALGMMYWRLGDFKSAENHFLQSKLMAEKINDTQFVLFTLNSLGAIYWGYGNYNIALGYYEKALKIASATGNNGKFALITINIGLIYHEWGKDKEAMNNYIEGLKIAQKENYPYGIAYGYSNMGVIYLQNKEYKKSIVSFDSALINYQKISKKIGIAFSYRNMGDSYFEAKKLEKAIYYYKLSVKTAREVNSKHHLALGLYALAKAYFENHNYDWANRAANQSLEISDNNKYKGIAKDNYFLLSNLALISGANLKALEYYKKASILKDSIFNEKSSKQFAEIQTKYETEKKVILLEKQKKEIEKNQLIIEQEKQQKYGLSFIIFLLLVTTFFGLRIRTKLKNKNNKLTEKYKEIDTKNYELELQKKEIEQINKELNDLTRLKELNTQMIVHDLKNPLNRIIATSKKKETEAEQKLYESSQYMLNLVENILSVAKIEQTGIKATVTAVNLNEVISDAYENTMFLFHNKGVVFVNEMTGNYKVIAESYLLKRIFINLFTNASKFTPSGGRVVVSAKITNNKIDIEVKDTGIGIRQEKTVDIFDLYKFDKVANDDKVSSTGIGLFFIKNAVEALGSTIKVESEPNMGARFIFSLRLMEKMHAVPQIINEKNKKIVFLNDEETTAIKNILAELSQTELYEVTTIKKLIAKINPTTDNMNKWLNLMNESIANFNTDLFQKLINSDHK